MSIEEKRATLKVSIDQYFRAEREIFSDDLTKAVLLAVQRWNEQMNRETRQEIVKLREDIISSNHSESVAGTILDIAIGVAMGPLFGHLFERGLKTTYAALLQFRRSTERAAEESKYNLDNFMRFFLMTVEKKEFRQSVDSIIDTTEYYKYCTGFANDASQYVADKLRQIKGGSPTPTSQTLDRIYGKRERITDLMGKQPQKVSPLQEKLFRYLIEQKKITDIEWLKFSLSSAVIKDEQSIDKGIRYFEDKTSSINISTQTLMEDISLIFEAVVWVYYLGDPRKWARKRAVLGVGGEHYSKWSRDKPGPYNESVEEKKRDFRGVFASLEKRFNLPPPYAVYEMDVFIPMSLFDYLLDEFMIPGSKRNFSSLYKEEEQAELAKVFPRPPMEGVLGAKIAALISYPNSPELQNASYANLGHDDSARQYATFQMIEWFKNIAMGLDTEGKKFGKLLGMNDKIPRVSF